jgi:hypothetical protein
VILYSLIEEIKLHEYGVRRKLQEQSGSYFVILPKIWVESQGLKEGDVMSLKFNDSVKIEPFPKKAKEEKVEMLK